MYNVDLRHILSCITFSVLLFLFFYCVVNFKEHDWKSETVYQELHAKGRVFKHAANAQGGV